MGTRDLIFHFLLTIIYKALHVMNALKKVLSSVVVALAMTVSLNVSAAEKAMKPAEAIEITASKAEVALAAFKNGSNADEIIKLIKETSEAAGDVDSNYKMGKARDTVIIHLKVVRNKVKEGQMAEAEEGLKNAIKEISDLKNSI
jgi:hypothetical protein